MKIHLSRLPASIALRAQPSGQKSLSARFTIAKPGEGIDARQLLAALKFYSQGTAVMERLTAVTFGKKEVLVGPKKGGPIDGAEGLTFLLKAGPEGLTAHSYDNPTGDPVFEVKSGEHGALTAQMRATVRNLSTLAAGEVQHSHAQSGEISRE